MSSAAPTPKPFILLVEDERTLREHLARELADEFEVASASTGEEALATVLKRRPDLVVTDILLPGMDGIELVKILRDRPSTASIPILMMSGRTAEELRDGFELGADAYLGKPYTERELRTRIRGMLKNVELRAQNVRAEARAETERQALVERAALLESITDAFYAVDREWRVTYVNQRAIDYFGLPKNAILGKIFWEVFPQLRNTVGQHEAERAVAEQIPIALEFRSPVSGRWLDVHAYPHQDGLAVNFKDISDRKRADALLRESERRLRLMSDSLPALVSFIDPHYIYQFCNKRYEEWFGVASSDVLGRSMQQILGEAAFATIKPFIDRALGGEEVVFESRVPYRTGGTRHVYISYLPEMDELGAVHGCYAFVQDITERKGAELRLQESEARFRSMADNAPVMVWVTDANGSCTFLSRSWHEFTGQVLDDAGGLSWLRAVHADDRREVEGIYLAAHERREAFRCEYRLQRADGSFAWALDAASPRFNDVGEFLGFVGSLIDIQERREIEERLQTVNQLLEQRVADVVAERKVFADLVEGTDAFVQVVDMDYRWIAINHASAQDFEEIFGVRPRVGDSMLELLKHQPANQAAVKEIWARALAGEEFSQLSEFGDPALARRHYEMKVNCLRDRNGRLIGAYQFAYDVTQRVREQAQLHEAQEALRQSQKMETLGQLTGGVAHDFNNLLTPIVGALDMLSRRHVGDPRAQRLTSGALQASDRAKTLIQRLLAFARRQHLESRPVDVRLLLNGVRDLLARTLGPRIDLSIQVDASLPAAKVDPNQLELALLNLAVNARDAMPDGGSLVVRATAEHTHPKLGKGRFIRVCVQDTGAGMDAHTLNRAIEPFFTTKAVGQGTGLGLSMVHGLAAQSGGDFTLDSTPGIGTTAQLWLPVSAEPPTSASEDEAAVNAHSEVRASTVLLVDDEPLVRVGTSEMLMDGGYNVVEASSAEEALQLLRNGLKIDALVTDFAMPGRTGAQLARELKAERPGLPILLITGFASLSEVEAGGIARLAKPFRQTDLLATLAEVIGE